MVKNPEFRLAIIKFLVEQGADINVKDQGNNNQTALHLAAVRGDSEICQYLIEQVDNINVKDKHGRTPSQWATHNNIKVLLSEANQKKAVQKKKQETMQQDKLQVLTQKTANVQSNVDQLENRVISLEKQQQADSSRINQFALLAPQYNATLNQFNKIDCTIYLQEEKLAQHNDSIISLEKTIKTMVTDFNQRLAIAEKQIKDKAQENVNILRKLDAAVEEIVKLNERVMYQERQLYQQQSHIEQFHGQINYIQTLSNNKSDVNITLDDLLWTAVKNGNERQLNAWLKLDVDVDVPDQNGLTLLHWAVLQEHKAIIISLLDKNFQLLNMQDKVGRTALHYAAQNGSLELVITLLHHKAALDIKDQQDKTAYELAQNDSIRKTIANHMLFNAAKIGSKEAARNALESGADINAVDTYHHINETALHKAAYAKNSDLIEFLIKNGADTQIKDKYGNTPAEVISDAKIQEKIRQAEFLKAVQDNNITLINNLAAEGLDLKLIRDEFSSAVLHIAISNYKSLDTIKTLLSLGADINATNEHGQTPLHIAASLGNQEIVMVLLQNGANKKIEDVDGNRPYDLAYEKGHPDLAKLIRKNKINNFITSQVSDNPNTFFSVRTNVQLNESASYSADLENSKMPAPTTI